MIKLLSLACVCVGPVLMVVGTVGFGTEKMFGLLACAFIGAIALSAGVVMIARSLSKQIDELKAN